MNNSAYPIDNNIISRVSELLKRHKDELRKGNPVVLQIPEKDIWKSFDDNRLWSIFFFSIISSGGSKTAREYLQHIENGSKPFELHPSLLKKLPEKKLIEKIWKFGTGDNFLNKRLGRFFGKPEKIGSSRSFEYKLSNFFRTLEKKGFKNWLININKMSDDRKKAKVFECFSGIDMKKSRDLLNNLGITDTLIPLDVHILREMRENWGWDVPGDTPSNRKRYEAIEDSVRIIAEKCNCSVVEIDKAIFSARAVRINGTQKQGKKSPHKKWPKHNRSSQAMLKPKKQGTIWDVCYQDKDFDEIKEVNPFATPGWLQNTANLSATRLSAIHNLFNGKKDVDTETIKSKGTNFGRYAAFRAIAHNIAKWDNDRLVKK